MDIFYEGIILKVSYFREDDRIIKIFTNTGIITVIGKSIKKGKRANLIDIGNYIRFNIVKGKNLNILTSINLIDSFYNIKGKNPFYMFYICEVLLKIQREDQDETSIFNMTLYVLSKIHENFKLSLIFFNLHILKMEGLLVDFKYCFVCEKELVGDLSFSKNGISHSTCYHLSPISLGVASLLEKISKAKTINGVFNQIDVDHAFIISLVLLENFLEYKIKSKEYILKNL